MKVNSLVLLMASTILLSACAVKFENYTVLKPEKPPKYIIEDDEYEYTDQAGKSGTSVKYPQESTAEFLKTKRQQLLKSGNSPDFVDGYSDGCSSGKHAIGDKNAFAQKDPNRYKMVREYSIGWERGYSECRDAGIEKMQQAVKQEYVPSKDPAEEQLRQKIWDDIRK